MAGITWCLLLRDGILQHNAIGQQSRARNLDYLVRLRIPVGYGPLGENSKSGHVAGLRGQHLKCCQ